jgi:hypothetical protein
VPNGKYLLMLMSLDKSAARANRQCQRLQHDAEANPALKTGIGAAHERYVMMSPNFR